MKKKLMVLLMGTSLALAACGGGDSAEEAPKEEGNAPAGETASAGDAEKLFQQSCAACHGQDLSGGAGPNLQQVGGKYSKEDIENIIINGQGGMPKGVLKGEDASKVAEWLAAKK